MSDYFKDAWDFNNLGINREKSIFLTPKASQSGGSGENKSTAPKKQTTKSDNKPVKSKTTSKKPTSKSDESAKAMKYWNMKAEMNRTEQEKDSLKTEFDKEMEILHRPDVNDILKKEKSMKDPYFKDLRSMDKEQATKKLISDHEDLEIERGKIPKKNNNEFEYIFSNLLKQHPEIVPILKNKNANRQDFDVWRADQLIKGAFGNEKDKAYYDQRIKDGSKYNDLRKNADFDFYVNKGLDMFWGPTINDIKADELPDKTLPVYNLTKDEKSNYAYLKGKYGENEAKKYHWFLKDELKTRANEAKEKKAADSAKRNPLLATLKAFGLSFISGIQSAGNIGMQLLDETVHPALYEPNEVTIADNSLKNEADAIIDSMKEQTDSKVLKAGYDILLSSGENLIDGYLEKIKPLAPYIILNNTGNAAADFMENGMSKGDAIISGLLSGGTEYLTSKININNPKYKIFESFAENCIVNAINSYLDTIFMDENSKYYQAYLNNYYEKEMNPYEAKRYANIEAHFLNPLKESLYIPSTNYSSIEPFMDLDKVRQKIHKSAWDVTEEEFDNYINSIMFPE